MHKPVFTSNTLESLVEYAVKDFGIIGAYNNMSLISKSNLKLILPEIKSPLIQWYISSLESFKKDTEINKIKNYLIKSLNNLN